MMKHCSAVQPGFRIFANSFVLILLLSASPLLPQIELNGFGTLRFVQTQRGSQNIVMHPAGESTRIITYGNAIQLTHITQSDSPFVMDSRPAKIPVTSLLPFKTSNLQYQHHYFFISRANRVAGVIKIDSSGESRILKQLSLSSYPEYLDTDDSRSDAPPAMLLSGPSYSGITVIEYDRKGQFRTREVAKREPFTHARFVYLNNDAIPDIAAYQLYSNEIVFFFGNGDGTFSRVRSFRPRAAVTFLTSYDLNKDSYDDIIYGGEGYITVLYGDGRAAFERESTMNIPGSPCSAVAGDFNANGRNDLIFCDRRRGTLYALFGIGDGFTEPFPVISNQSLIAFSGTAGDKLALLQKDGKVILFSGTAAPDGWGHYGIGDFAADSFIRQTRNEVVLTSPDVQQGKVVKYHFNRTGKILRRSSLSISLPFTTMLSDGSGSAYWFYTPGGKQLEVIRYNNQNKPSRRFIQFSAPVSDILVQDDGEEYAVIHSDQKQTVIAEYDSEYKKTGADTLDGKYLKGAFTGEGRLYIWTSTTAGAQLFSLSDIEVPITTVKVAGSVPVMTRHNNASVTVFQGHDTYYYAQGTSVYAGKLPQAIRKHFTYIPQQNHFLAYDKTGKNSTIFRFAIGKRSSEITMMKSKPLYPIVPFATFKVRGSTYLAGIMKAMSVLSISEFE